MMPHNDRTAWIDDGDGSKPAAFARAAPMLHDGLSPWFSDRGREWLRERWQRVACYDPSIPPTPPDKLPLGYLFPGAGHVYMRSAWNDPNATWAFFGCGPQYAGHARDDEGHFLICKRGALVSRQGGQGHNDTDFYSGGSLIFNIVTLFDPQEKFRRDQGNENDGGLLLTLLRQPVKVKRIMCTGKSFASHGQWRLAPAIDLNPFPDRVRELKTWISEDTGPEATVDAAARPGDKHSYAVISVNSVGLRSKASDASRPQ